MSTLHTQISNHWHLFGIEHCFYDDDRNWQYASKKLIKSHLSEDMISSSGAHNATQLVKAKASKSESDLERKVTSIVARKFRIEERFTGKMGQDIHKYIATYNKTAKDYQLGDNQKLQYLHNHFDSDPKRFYRTIQGRCGT